MCVVFNVLCCANRAQGAVESTPDSDHAACAFRRRADVVDEQRCARCCGGHCARAAFLDEHDQSGICQRNFCGQLTQCGNRHASGKDGAALLDLIIAAAHFSFFLCQRSSIFHVLQSPTSLDEFGSALTTKTTELKKLVLSCWTEFGGGLHAWRKDDEDDLRYRALDEKVSEMVSLLVVNCSTCRQLAQCMRQAGDPRTIRITI